MAAPNPSNNTPWDRLPAVDRVPAVACGNRAWVAGLDLYMTHHGWGRAGWRRARWGAGAVVLAVAVSVAGCTSGGQPRPGPVRIGTAAASGSASAGTVTNGPAPGLRGRALTGPTGLRLLVEGLRYDVDAGTGRATGVTSWLHRVSGPPILLIELSQAPDVPFGAVTVEPVAGTTPLTLRVKPTAGSHGLAPSLDGRGMWVSDYRSRTNCALRELNLTGQQRRPERAIACGVDPLLETSAGLWVRRWVNVFTFNGRSVQFTEPTYALLDPRTLREKISYEEAFVVGAHHVLTMDDREQNLVLRDLRTGSAVPLTKPAEGYTFFVFNARFPLARVSPDGRYAVFRLGSYSGSRQIIDLWALDLTSASWHHVPGMPVYGSLKYASEAWAPDGRLVMLGQYGMGNPVLATWRPGDPQVAVRPAPLPQTLYDAGLGSLLVADVV